MKKHLALSFYHFVCFEDPAKEVQRLKNYFKNKDIKGRIYISKEGINAQLSSSESDGKKMIEWLQQDSFYKGAKVKIQRSDEHAFYKMTVKVREQLVAIDCKVNLQDRGEHVSSEKWSEMLQAKDKDTILIDVRNDYEWEVGHFEGAILPKCSNFREFHHFAKELRQKKDPKKTKVMMYCTGGIRCEYFSPLLKEMGFEKVYQLEGGIIEYGNKQGSKYWKGKLFVFDDRLTVSISNDSFKPISFCKFCKEKCSTYYNCANMDCNELFLSCFDCIEKQKGCCNETCKLKGRVREYDRSRSPKPFRKISHEEKVKRFQSSKPHSR